MNQFSKKQMGVVIGIAVVVIGVIGYYLYTVLTQENEVDWEKEVIQNVTSTGDSKAEEGEIIVVHIAGQVNKPGIVKIKEGARIADIIEQAGGLTQQADLSNVNLAYIVEDGQKIVIPDRTQKEEEYISDESGDTVVKEETTKNTGGKIMININKAEQTQLEQLPGIGPSTALKIIEYRKQNGNFNSIEDIKNVPGIGDAKFETMKENISVK